MLSQRFEPVGSGRACAEDESYGWIRGYKDSLFTTPVLVMIQLNAPGNSSFNLLPILIIILNLSHYRRLRQHGEKMEKGKGRWESN